MVYSEAFLKKLPHGFDKIPVLPTGTGVFVVETLAESLAVGSLVQLNEFASGWKLARRFDRIDRKDAHRLALEIRDAGRNTTGDRPMVRVRELGGVTEMISQRLAFRN